MSSYIASQGDVVGGGAIIDGAESVRAGGRAVAFMGSVVTPHGEASHSASTIIAGSLTVFAEGKNVAAMGDVATCGDVIAEGDMTIIVGD